MYIFPAPRSIYTHLSGAGETGEAEEVFIYADLEVSYIRMIVIVLH